MKWVGSGAVAVGSLLGLMALGCGDESAAVSMCGEGTFFKDGACVSAAGICGEGTSFDGTDCVASGQVGCGPGTKLEAQTCVLNSNDASLSCGQGTKRQGDTCVAITVASLTCGEGTQLDGKECVPTATDSAVKCGLGTKLSNGDCLPEDSLSCGTGTVRKGDECLPVAGVVCGAGTKLQGNECISQATTTCGDGTTLSNGVCLPVAVSCGPGTHLQGAACVPNGAPSTVPTSETFSFKIAEKGGHVVYFLDQAGTAVHRYDLIGNKFLTPFATSALTASTMAVTPVGDKVYLGNIGGRIDIIDTATGSTSFLAAGPSTLLWMTVTGDFLYTIDDSGAWESHATFSRATGERVFSDEWRNVSFGAYYAPGIKRIFTFRDGTSPNDIYYEEVNSATGALSNDFESPYHGDYALGHPIRVSPDESTVYVASGVSFSTTDLKYKSSIGISYTDLAFDMDHLYLLHPKGAASEVVVLDSKYAIVYQFDLPGTPLRLFVQQGKLLTFTRQAAISVSSTTL